MSNIWKLRDAKSKFSELVERALLEGVQIVTRRGIKAVVILPFEEYERLTKPSESLATFLLSSPLSGAELKITRDESTPPQIEIVA